MGEVNLPRGERDALNSIDVDELDRLIQQAVLEMRGGGLHGTRLASCGIYVSGRLSGFERALADHAKAKAPEKVAETKDDARRAGARLMDAVRDEEPSGVG